MSLLRKYLLSNIAAFAPRERVVDALGDETDPPLDPADDQEGAGDPDEFEDEEVLDDPDNEEEPELEAEPEPRQRTRGQQRIERLANDNRGLREEVAASQARLAALEARLVQPQQPTIDQQRDEEARLALMSPEERMNHRLERTIADNNRQTQAVLGSVQDQADATAFRALLKDKPHYAKLSDTVEKRAKELRQKGTPLPREAVLMFLVGEQAVKSQERPRQREQSQQRLAQQETRPSSGRGDVRGDRRSTGSTQTALEKRLSNVRL